MERKDYGKPLSLKLPEKKASIIFRSPEKDFLGFPDQPKTPPRKDVRTVFKSPEEPFRGFPDCKRAKSTTPKCVSNGTNYELMWLSPDKQIQFIQSPKPSMIKARHSYVSTPPKQQSEGSGSDTDTTEGNQEEFYNYLGIAMRPHEIVTRPDVTDLDIFKRRSLRVRYQKVQEKTSVEPKIECRAKSEEAKPDISVLNIRAKSEESTKPCENGVKTIKVEKDVKPEPQRKTKERRPFTKILKRPLPKLTTRSIKLQSIRLRAKYLRSSVCETSLRSGKERKERRPPKYLSIFKNKKERRSPVELLKLTKNEEFPLDAIKLEEKTETHPVVKLERKIPPFESPVSPLPQAPDSTVNLRTSIDSGSALAISHSDLNTLKNPLSTSDGDILHVFNESEILIVVQTSRISFWKYCTFKYLIGAEQTYELVGRCRRHNETDVEIDIHNTNRICFNDNTPIYVELRARQLPTASSCPLASTYAVIYSMDPKRSISLYHDSVTVKFVHLDSVQACAKDEIYFTTITGTRYLLMCWTQHLQQSERTGICKYSFTPDLSTLASIREIPSIKHRVIDLKSLGDTKVFGLGATEISIWNHESGDLLHSVDFGIDLGKHLSCFEYSNDMLDCLFLIQIFECSITEKKTLKVIGINLTDDSWRILKTQEISVNSNMNLADIRTSHTSNLLVSAIDYGRSIVVMSQNDAQGIKVLRNHVDNVQLFLNQGKVIEVSEKAIIVRGLDEYLLQL